MAKAYQNTGFAPGSSTFTEVLGSGFVSSFSGSNPKVKTAVGSIPVVNGKLVVTRPQTITGPGGLTQAVLTESMRMEFNVIDAAHLTQIRAELDRLFDAWVASYHATLGLVPPVSATFPEA